MNEDDRINGSLFASLSNKIHVYLRLSLVRIEFPNVYDMFIGSKDLEWQQHTTMISL